ncbi:MAG: hypothetical protein CMM01_06965 [Rhodopirellula sp.]|nr:hypothetical protein [Rhodopirellula sp.]OUX51888.1 MAG: hypothetical protein CBE43_02315 [Rhodopirellula sp. TMED283]
MSVIDSPLMDRRKTARHGSTIRFRGACPLCTTDRICTSLHCFVFIGFLLYPHGASLQAAPPSHPAARSGPSVDLLRKPVSHLPPGTLVANPQQSGFSNVVTIAMPRLAAGEIDSLPEYAKQYAGMFHFTALANVRTVNTDDRTDYLLDRFGVGISMRINGELVVVTPQAANEMGLKLGMIERGILKGNEKDLTDITQVARTSRMIIFDVPTNMLVDDKHDKQILRYFVWASPASGKLGILVWSLNGTRSDRYTIACKNMQLLPPNYTEDRAIHVSRGPLLSNIPTAKRFALVTIPQGTSVPFSQKMRTVATLRTITVQNLHTMMTGASDSLAMAPVIQQAINQPTNRK